MVSINQLVNFIAIKLCQGLCAFSTLHQDRPGEHQMIYGLCVCCIHLLIYYTHTRAHMQTWTFRKQTHRYISSVPSTQPSCSMRAQMHVHADIPKGWVTAGGWSREDAQRMSTEGALQCTLSMLMTHAAAQSTWNTTSDDWGFDLAHWYMWLTRVKKHPIKIIN